MQVARDDANDYCPEGARDLDGWDISSAKIQH